MEMKPKILGVITARGGSKGIPGKNIKQLLGKPLILWTIDAAQKSGVFDRLIVSTDDEAIAKVCREFGVEVPFMRPAELAQDKTPHLPVMQHAVSYLEEKAGYGPDYVMILQPTSPARQSFHIREAVDLITKTGADSVLSVYEMPENFHPHKALILGEDGMLKLVTGAPVRNRAIRRQDLPKAYWSVGAIYLFKTSLLFDKEPNFYGDKVAPYVLDRKYVVDINELADWPVAEEALSNIMNHEL